MRNGSPAVVVSANAGGRKYLVGSVSVTETKAMTVCGHKSADLHESTADDCRTNRGGEAGTGSGRI